ncbi:MAG TPA: hypothetical protein HA232_01585 [Methanocellales archaeon]|nr:hypothetical protein [Methanocellales archaeon]
MDSIYSDYFLTAIKSFDYNPYESVETKILQGLWPVYEFCHREEGYNLDPAHYKKLSFLRITMTFIGMEDYDDEPVCRMRIGHLTDEEKARVISSVHELYEYFKEAEKNGTATNPRID